MAPLIFICPVIATLSHSYKRRDVSAPARPLYELQQCPAVDAGLVSLMAKYIVGTLLQNGNEMNQITRFASFSVDVSNCNLEPSGHCMYRRVVTICTARLEFSSSTFFPHSVFMGFVWILEQTVIISLYNINSLVFITEI